MQATDKTACLTDELLTTSPGSADTYFVSVCVLGKGGYCMCGSYGHRCVKRQPVSHTVRTLQCLVNQSNSKTNLLHQKWHPSLCSHDMSTSIKDEVEGRLGIFAKRLPILDPLPCQRYPVHSGNILHRGKYERWWYH